MSKLLRAEFCRLFKNRLFYGVLLATMLVIAYVLGVRLYDGQVVDWYEPQYDDVILMGNAILIFLMAGFMGLFVGTEFSDGTIRNKLMVGHTRWKLYLTELVVTLAANLMMLAFWIGTVLVFGCLLIGTPDIPVGKLTAAVLITVAGVTAFTAILLFIIMGMANKSTGAVACLLLTMGLFFASIYISSGLNEPEFYEGYVITNSETMEAVPREPEPNPYYITGLKRVMYEKLHEILPVSQLLRAMAHDVERLGWMCLYDAVILAVSTVGGILVFRKKDLK